MKSLTCSDQSHSSYAGWFTPYFTLILLLYGSFFSDLALSLSSPDKIIKDLGFHRLNGEPVNFTLDKSDGTEGSLTNYKGRWIFLTFWEKPTLKE